MTALTARTTTTTDPDRAARQALLIDAVPTFVMGIALTAGFSALDGPLGIPSGWLLGIGLFCIAYATDLVIVARLLPRSRKFVRLFALGNLGWLVASVAVVVLGGFDLTGLGVAVVLAQAAAVGGFAVLQQRAAGLFSR